MPEAWSISVDELDESGIQLNVSELRNQSLPHSRTPECIEHAPVAGGRRPREVITPEPGLAVCNELIEDLIAGSDLGRLDHAARESVPGKLLVEEEGAGPDTLSNACRPHARRLRVLGRRRAPDGWSIPDAVAHEIKLAAVTLAQRLRQLREDR